MRSLLLTIIDTFRVFVRKCRGIVTGNAPVAKSCQIPDLKAHLLKCGLSARSGIFVEIGAFDGESFSNTSFLADQGWRGIYVEPVDAFCQRIRRRHLLNDVTIVKCAIGNEKGIAEINVMGPLSTVSSRSLDAYEQLDWTRERWEGRKRQRVQTLPLEEVLTDAKLPHQFDLLVIDVEGEEESIVSQLLSSPYRPKVAIIELEDRHPDFSQFENLVRSHSRARISMREAGYVSVFEDRINTIFFHCPIGAR